MYFFTTALLPMGNQMGQERSASAAFDKQTGELIPIWELFTCSKEVAIQTILDYAGIGDPVLEKEMAAALVTESIQFSREGVSVYFPIGSLPSQDTGYYISAPYEGALSAILHPWAIPNSVAE